jgi:hypothetical protein
MSSWGSLWPGLPATSDVIKSNDVYASVVDTPGAPGTYYYSIWGYDTASISTTTSELVCLTALQVAP